MDRRTQGRGVRREVPRDLLGRRLGDQHHVLDAGVEVEPRLGGAGREPADVGGQVAPTDAVGRGDADAGMVQEREHLLTAGA